MKKLDVDFVGWGERWPLGALAETGHQILFEYSPEARRQGLELSPLRLPLSHPGAFAGEDFFLGLPGLIADALPDGWGLLLMDRAFSRAGRRPMDTSPLDRLAFIGERAMGALAFRPPDPVALEYENLELARLAEEVTLVMEEAPAEGALRHLLLLGGSAQGARPKVLVDFTAATGSISSGSDKAVAGAAPWLVKFPAREEHRDACAIEELYARLARHCGLEMPESRFFDLEGGHGAFGVRRFDREGASRVPLLSLSALLHADYRLPALDYETLLRATRRLTGDEREVAKAFERCVINVLLHNRDDHSRNFAFRLNHDRLWKLAPVFDLTYCEGPGGEHQTSVAGEACSPRAAHLLEVARRGGLDPVQARSIIERLLDGLTALSALAADLPIRKRRLAEIRRMLAEDWRRVRET
jgi:serine/threonine-protein kinase HipA